MVTSLAADPARAMEEALREAERASAALVEARAAKRAAEQALRDREALLTLEVLSGGNGEKSNAELRKAQVAAALAEDGGLRTLRGALAALQQQIDEHELTHDHQLKKWHAAKAQLEHETSVNYLNAYGGKP